MINQSLLRRIQKKHPNRSLEEIEIIINVHLGQLNFKLCNCQVIDITVGKLGRIHTHGNAKYHNYEKQKVKIAKWVQEKDEYSDTNLLF